MRTQIPRIACTCGIEFRLIDRSIIKSWPPSARALIKKKRDTSEGDCLLDDGQAVMTMTRARTRAFVSSHRLQKWIDAFSHKRTACISQIFLSVERSRSTSTFQSLIFLLSHSRVAILARPAIFSLTLTRAERARACVRMHSSLLSQFLRTATVCAQCTCT